MQCGGAIGGADRKLAALPLGEPLVEFQGVLRGVPEIIGQNLNLLD